MRIPCIIIALLITLNALSQGQKTDLKKIIYQHGLAINIKNWESLESYILITESQLKNGNTKLTSTSKKDGNQFRLDFLTPESIIVKSYNGQKGWISIDGQISHMSNGEAKEMAEEGQFYYELAVAYKRGYTLQLLSEEKFDGNDVYKIKMIKSDVDEQIYYLNKKTSLIEAVKESSEDPHYEGISFLTKFEDYKEIEGLILPTKMHLFSGKKKLRSYTFISLKVNPTISNSNFDPPNPWLTEKLRSTILAQFDFWLGDWEVFDFSSDQLLGRSKIEKIIDGFGVQENYLGIPGPFHGKSFNKYNFFARQWEQFWIDNSGLTHYFTGNYSDEEGMVLTKEEMRGDKKIYHRLVFYPNADGTVRQTWTQSEDNNTWTTNFDGIYKKRTK